MSLRRDGEVAIVTGGGTGIGRAVALALAAAGARVVVTGRRREKLDEAEAAARTGGLSIRGVVADVTDDIAVSELIGDVEATEGAIDVLVNNAGSFSAVGPLWEVDADDWWRDVTINLKGVMLCTKAVLPGMMRRGRGTIFNLDGGGGADGANRGGSGYGASKAAVARLTETLARELATEGSAVQVYGIFPGLVRSEMTENLIASPEQLRWQAFVSQSFDKQTDRPATDCADAIMTLLEIGGADLSGRSFTVDDDFAEIARRRAEIARDELLIMRLKHLPKDT